MIIPPEAENWRKSAGRTKRGEKILKNVEQEKNVPSRITRKFFEKLVKMYKPSTDPLDHMERILFIVQATALSGHKAIIGDMELLIRFARLARLPEQLIFKKAGISFQRLLRNLDLVDKLTEIQLGNRRGIVWGALEKVVSADFDGSKSIEKILDKMGLTDKFEESWYSMIYNVSDLDSDCKVPTVFDAGANEWFKPSGENAPHGMTSPISGMGSGYPEYVHEQCTINQPSIKTYKF